jgi:hypothetical protein
LLHDSIFFEARYTSKHRLATPRSGLE